jgi:hypothetical protein
MESVFVSQQHLQSLRSVVWAIAEHIEQNAVQNPGYRDSIRAAISAECVQCGMRLTGEDLWDWLQTDGSTAASPKLTRLQQGYCARRGCDSYYYTLTLKPCARTDWKELVAQAGPMLPFGQAQTVTLTRGPKVKYGMFATSVAIGLALVMFLLLLRQYYLGSPIPWVREPEDFKVDRFEGAFRP